LAVARDRWRRADIKNYDLRYRMHGSEYAIEVRGGAVVRATVNGRPPTSSDWQVFGVDGLLDTLEQELDLAEGAADAEGGPGASAMLRVRFHAQWGYIERYVRSMPGARAAALEVSHFARAN
jgi:hypothetical protein